jgi:hypothetical protein
MALPASDAFSGTNGQALTSYSSNWSLNAGNFEIFSNGIRSDVDSAETAARWNADSFTADQYSQLTITTVSGATYIGPAVRLKTDGSANYYGLYTNPSSRYLFKTVNGTQTILANATVTFNDQDTLRVDVVGATLTPKVNGSLDANLGAHTDSAHAIGQAGICGYGDSGIGTFGDDFLADNIGAPLPPLTIQEPALFPNPRIYFYQ